VSIRRSIGVILLALATLFPPRPAEAQPFTYRGFVELRGYAFPNDAPNDPDNLVADFLARGEVFATPVAWLQLAGGLDVRANSHDQVTDSWRFDFSDRTRERPAVAIRRLNATFSRGRFTFDAGKQFIRWGKTDIVTPTDRFAPRDFLNIVDTEFLAVRGGRLAYVSGDDTLDVVWVPWFTPSRIPLLTQRWTVIPAGIQLTEQTGELPGRSQAGVRWSRINPGYEFSLSFYDGVNHLPDIELDPATLSIERRYPRVRSYGGDVALPLPWFTAKGEAALLESVSADSDDYVLYVLQVERQTGEWTFIGGYAGELLVTRRTAFAFAPDRGTSKSVIGRASYTLGPDRSAAIEGALRQNGGGAYVKGEFSQARGQHWRVTLSGTMLAGESEDFLGQFDRNSHIFAALRYSF
jgi:hypothetical protein